ncbi:hypothetical protein [Candidatus Methylomicrobium oryzae]|jgi:hypothetical protein|uniref:hypothetical protein n=1 Tax=Candidatus Methylomicrobium oryzae TaxID=2802053 RepID=UPI001920EC01|nr:hypothetical protein [Methylomicrobium sp. RS1]MBL1264679.1 hypothetical protein [Methylomicrobium sp. RS1]
MKKHVFLAAALLASGSAFATTDHYLLREGNHVHHLKITKLNDEITVSTDVDFEPNANEKDAHACSADVSGEAKVTGENELLMRKHIEGQADYCELKIKLSPNGAKIEQSTDCGHFAAGICHFSSDGKELVKIK